MLETEVKKGVFEEENLLCTILKEQEKRPTTIQVQEDNTAEKRAVEGYRLIDMTILAKLIGELSCPEC